jgi:serine/threonine-protein kinase
MLEVVEVELVRGLVVAGKWRLERPIGRGGFGVVWAAVDIATKEPRALKCLTHEGATDAKRQERLRREARAMSSIAHPNVARVFGVEDLPAGTPFIVMELLQGVTLHARLSIGPLSVVQTREVLTQIADALRTVHARGIVHRDLKPANVFIVDDRTVRVLDFGIAKDLSAGERHKLTTTGTTLGTLNYMAPEQIFGERNIDARCDVWALGILAHECLTLRRPTDADGDNSGQVLKKILEGNFPRLSTLVADCPPDLDELVARMLMKNAADRPTSEEAFTILNGPACAPTVPGPLGKTNPMLGTLPLSDSPMNARTVRDKRFAGSLLVPSAVAPPTVVPSTMVPSTVVPSTVMPSTVMPSTVLVAPTGDARPALASTLPSEPGPPPRVVRAVAPAPAPAPAPALAPAVTPVRARPAADQPTFDVRPRHQPRGPRTLAIVIAVVAGLAVMGVSLFALTSARARRAENADAAVATAASATASSRPSPAASIASSPAPHATASSSVAPPSASSAATPTAPATTARAGAVRPSPASSRPHAGAHGTTGDDPPISNQRF